MFHDKRMYEMKKEDLRNKNLSSWQNIWNSSQIATDIKAKLANQEGTLRGGISRIYLFFSNIWKPCLLRSYQHSVT